MKKALKIVGMVLLVLAILIVALVKYLGSRPSAPTNYQQTVATGGELEQKYMANGGYAVASYEEAALQGFGKYLICYPETLSDGDQAYPVIVLCNGTGVPMSRYTAVANHFASWGFVVIGTEEEYDWNGFAAEMCIRHLMLLNESERVNDRENPFYRRIDLDNVGIVGHSQGGVGVLNAITTQQHRHTFKAAVAISPTNMTLAQALQWDYDAHEVSIPTMLISGEGGGDDWVVTGEELQAIYEQIPSAKAMCRRKNTPHGETLYAENGYVTAWFLYWLQGDVEAGSAVWGEEAEIMHNALYQDQRQETSGIQ